MDLKNEKQAQRFLHGVTLGFLAQHLIFVGLFLARSLWVMAGLNTVCALGAGAALWLFSRKMPRAYMLAVYCTELVCLAASAILLGHSAGLQLPLIGLTLLVFFGEYLGRSMKQKSLPALPFSLANLGVFLAVFGPRFHKPGLLTLSESFISSTQLVWSAAVFALCIAGVTIIVQMDTDSERLLLDQAESDKLTGLYNRAGYDQLLPQLELGETTLLLVDGDKFKHVNDTYGHAVGDQVLKKIAFTLKKNFRREDYVCRIGGDEFVVLMIASASPERELIERKVNRINRELSHVETDRLPLASVSIGVAFGAEAADWKELFNRADEALYQVKQAGGRGCRFYEVSD